MTIDEQLLEAMQQQAAGNTAAAAQTCRLVLDVHPYNPQALHLLGLLTYRSGRLDEALDLLGKSIKACPDNAEFHSNFAAILGSSGRFEEALSTLQHAIAIQPDHARSHANLGATFERMGRLNDALVAYRRAIGLPGLDSPTSTYTNMGNVLKELGQADLAEFYYRKAIQLDSQYSLAWQKLARLLYEQARHSEGLEAMRRAVSLSGDAAVHSDLLHQLIYAPSISAAQIFAEHMVWSARHESGLASAHIPHDNDRTSARRLRVGYVSPDFRQHSVATFFEPLLTHHDHSQFEVILYSSTGRPDALTTRLRTKADEFQDISRLSDDLAENLIRHNKVDILVDLTGHMGGNRLCLFARKPAPIQVTYVGHPNTTGMATIDYRLTDVHLDPPGDGSDAFHSERLIRLSKTFACYQPPDEDFPICSPPFERNGYVTFGCLNNPAKITESVISLWCRILQAVPGARLLLLGDTGVKQIERLFAAGGVGPSRVARIGQLNRHSYFEAFNRIDIGLDCFPCNGHTTTCDGLWMGVPVVTIPGCSYVSRMGLSVLSNLGLSELIAASTTEYVRIATILTSDPLRLSALRNSMRERLKSSPIMDGAGLTREIETAYRMMWSGWCRRVEKSPGCSPTSESIEIAN